MIKYVKKILKNAPQSSRKPSKDYHAVMLAAFISLRSRRLEVLLDLRRPLECG